MPTVADSCRQMPLSAKLLFSRELLNGIIRAGIIIISILEKGIEAQRSTKSIFIAFSLWVASWKFKLRSTLFLRYGVYPLPMVAFLLEGWQAWDILREVRT